LLGAGHKKNSLEASLLSYFFFFGAAFFFAGAFFFVAFFIGLILPLHQITHAPERARLCPLYKMLWK
jgi:hypothetical protein